MKNQENPEATQATPRSMFDRQSLGKHVLSKVGTEFKKDDAETLLVESEVQRNVGFWHKLGFEVNEKDVKEKIEALPRVEGMDWLIYVPEDLKTRATIRKANLEGAIKQIPGEKKLWSMMTFWIKDKNGKHDFTPRSNAESSYAIATRHQQEPDEDSLGDKARTAIEWQKSDSEFMQPNELIIANMMWQLEHGGDNYLDTSHITMCPGSMVNNGIYGLTSEDEGTEWVKYDGLRSYPRTKVHTIDINPYIVNPNIGVRKIVTAKTSAEQE